MFKKKTRKETINKNYPVRFFFPPKIKKKKSEYIYKTLNFYEGHKKFYSHCDLLENNSCSMHKFLPSRSNAYLFPSLIFFIQPFIKEILTESF